MDKQIIEALEEFCTYGVCRHANTWERKIMAERFEQLALKYIPLLNKLQRGAGLPESPVMG